MLVKSVASLFIVTAILFVFAVGSEIFIDDFMKPRTLFGYLIVSTLITGIVASVVIEKIDAKILD